MKIAFCNEMFADWSIERQFDFIAECGYDGVELAPFSVDPHLKALGTSNVNQIDSSRRKEIIRCSTQFGIPVSGLHWLLAKTSDFYLTSPDPLIRAKTAQYFINLIDFCSELGGTYLVLGSPMQRNLLPGISQKEAVSFAIDVLTQILPSLEKTNLLLAIEPLAPSETNFLQTAGETVSLLHQMGNPVHLSLHLDCKAMSGGETKTIPEIITNAENVPFIKTFHANDPNLQGPGFGNLDFVPILKALESIHFNGWISVEPFDYSPGVECLAQKSIQYLKNCLSQ
ncbi:MAG: sugar phosphate isomerase/epimerase family protein [Planctomycetia bacterium]|nr:sugar phosphate isomerase/epimerase family protein [Planctomycetia bacterium]